MGENTIYVIGLRVGRKWFETLGIEKAGVLRVC